MEKRQLSTNGQEVIKHSEIATIVLTRLDCVGILATHFGSRTSLLTGSWSLFRPSWSLPGGSWGPLGDSWGALGGVLGPLECLLGRLGSDPKRHQDDMPKTNDINIEKGGCILVFGSPKEPPNRPKSDPRRVQN